MSIAGIAKEVTTISVSAWFFGDQLTPLNIVGVAITICGMHNSFPLPDAVSNIFPGIALFTHHKYQKSLDSTVPLDAHGNPVVDEDGDEPAGGDDGYVALGDSDRLSSERIRTDHEGVGVQND